MSEPAQARKALIHELTMSESNFLECCVELFGPLAGRPLEVECRKGSLEFGKIRLIGALVCARLSHHCQLTARDRLFHNLSELADLMVELVCTNVESLVVDDLQWGLEHGLKRARHILYMHDWPPGCAITVNHDAASRESAPHQIVENSIEAHARRETVNCPVAAERWREAFISELAQRYFRINLGTSIFGLGSQRRGLVDSERFRHAIHDARGGENETRHACLFRELREADGAFTVDFACPMRVQVSHRIIAQRRQVDHRVEPDEIAGGDLTQVLAQGRYRCEVRQEPAREEIVSIQADYIVALALEPRRHDGADIAVVAGN